jgi:FAD synthetase
MIEELVEKYIGNAQHVFNQVDRRSSDNGEAEKVLDYAKRYLEDAVYYNSQKRFETALASVAYCEGLLDALRLLGMVEFQWPAETV